jgi:hypothetical protein
MRQTGDISILSTIITPSSTSIALDEDCWTLFEVLGR